MSSKRQRDRVYFPAIGRKGGDVVLYCKVFKRNLRSEAAKWREIFISILIMAFRRSAPPTFSWSLPMHI